MSAIFGVYSLNGQPVDPEDLERMADSVAHRGPDAAGLWNGGPVGLGHRMLWTTPETFHEKPPLVNEAGGVVLTADARIDNREALIAALGLADRRDREITDGELILSTYEQWGERCPEKLLGDFAFAIWDQRRRTLFCARDHIGVKPFYYHYHQTGRAFVFASEIKGLLRVPAVPRRLNEVRVADHLAQIFEDQAITFYRDIFRLPAGHCMTVGREGIRIRRYWALDPSREVRLKSDEEYAEAFREIFTDAVRCRLRSAFPVGSMLSGGLDSSSIACTAGKLLAEEGERRLHTFSAIFPGLPEAELRKIDERPFIEAVLTIDGFEPHYVHADRLSPLADLERVLWHEDEAFFVPNLYIPWALYGAAQQHGVRILLDGLDGDTTVSHGLGYLAELARAGMLKTLAREVTALSKHYNASPRRVLWQFGLRPLVPEPVRQAWRLLRSGTQPTWMANTAIDPAFARHVGLAARVGVLRRNGSTPVPTARGEHWRGLTSALLPYALEVIDRAAAAFSLEPRYPFFDRRLMEFCLALPARQKLHRGWTRVVLRQAMANILPDEVRWRIRKANLSPNFKRALLEYERGTLEEVILNTPEIIEGYVDVPALRAAYHRYASQPLQHEGEALLVYRAVILALWLRRTGLTP